MNGDFIGGMETATGVLPLVVDFRRSFFLSSNKDAGVDTRIEGSNGIIIGNLLQVSVIPDPAFLFDIFRNIPSNLPIPRKGLLDIDDIVIAVFLCTLIGDRKGD